jgi:hypothetical protein
LPAFQILGVQFGVSESTANYIFDRRVKILTELMPASFLKKVKNNDSEYSWVIEILTEFELIVGSYAQAIQRPKDYQQQKNNYEKIAKKTYHK